MNVQVPRRLEGPRTPAMTASRAYITGLGTTGVLLGFALLLLLVVSAILSFRGWPGGGAAGDGSVVRIDGGPALTRLAPVRFEPAAAAGADGSTLGAGAASAATASGSVRDAGGVGGVGTSGGDASTPAGAGAGARPADGQAEGTRAPAGQDVGGVMGGVADTTESVAGDLSQALGGVEAPLGGAETPLGETVSGAGDTVSGLVEQGGDAAQRQLPDLP
jgi:hypothetical protein